MKNLSYFKNKTILITGASSGIGLAIAKKLMKIDCKLILISRRIEILEKLKSESTNAEINAHKNDVSDKEDVNLIYEKLKKNKIDIAILNAGKGNTYKPGSFNIYDAEEIMKTNYFGVLYWIEHIIKMIGEDEKGIIAVVSSLADVRGFSSSGFYSSSKAALSNIIESLRIDFRKKIKFITIRPGFVDTAMTKTNDFPMPFLMSSENAAEIILKGIEKEKSIIQFPFPMVLLTSIIKFLPSGIYDFLSEILYLNKTKT